MAGIAITRFSIKMDAPIADIIKYRNGALLSLRGLYATLSIISAKMAEHMAAEMNAKGKGNLKNVRKKNPKYAPNIITPPWAKLLKFIILYTRE